MVRPWPPPPPFCSYRRVWRESPDTAARIASWVRWLVWLMTFGRSGQLPWVLENTCGGCWNPEDDAPGALLALPPAQRVTGELRQSYPPKPPPPPPPPPRRYP
jgi:hypothetical protein